MKTLLKIALGVGCVIALAMGALFYFTGPLVDTADSFFQALKEGDVTNAYSNLSGSFQATAGPTEVESYMAARSLNQIKESSWTSRSIGGGQGQLTGSVTTDSGSEVPVTLEFVKTEGSWKINSIQTPVSGFIESRSANQPPTEQQQVQLVVQAMQVFALSANEKNMTAFHQHIANIWQRQDSVEQLNAAFAPFTDLNNDLTVLESFSPIFDEKPVIDEKGLLKITGYYPTSPGQVHFELVYVFEGLSWKLFGFNIDIKQ